MFGFIKNAVKAAGHGIHAGVGAVSHVTGAIGHKLSMVPVIGPGLQGVYEITTMGPIRLTAGIVDGERVDHLVLGTLKHQIDAVHEIAPYAQTIVSVVPGVGQGLSGAMGASLALANGQPLDEAMTAAIKGAIPGGPMAQAAFSLGHGLMAGKPLDQAALNSLPIPEQQKTALISGIQAAKDITEGKKVDAALYNAAKKNLPKDLQNALNTGVAVAHAQTLQGVIHAGTHAGVISKLGEIGAAKVASIPILKFGTQTMPPDTHHGFEIGHGLMSHSNVPPQAVVSAREQLTPEGKKGFDIALASHIGMTTAKAPTNMTAREKFGFYVGHGAQALPPENKGAVLATMANDNSTHVGLSHALAQVHAERTSLWNRFAHWSHLDKIHFSKPAAEAVAAAHATAPHP